MIFNYVKVLLLGLVLLSCNTNTNFAREQLLTVNNSDSLIIVALEKNNYKLLLVEDENTIKKKIDWFLHINACQWNNKKYDIVATAVTGNINGINKYNILCSLNPIGKVEIWNCNDSISAMNTYKIFSKQESFSCIADKVFAYMGRYKNKLLIISCDIPCSDKMHEFNKYLIEFVSR